MGLKTLVVTSCTGEKKFKPANQLIMDDFIDPLRLAKREAALNKYRMTAGQMYTGMQHLRLIEGIERLRNMYGHDLVDLCIVSAGYGLLPEDKEIVPYEISFTAMGARRIRQWAEFLNIKEVLNQKIKGYNLVFFLLGKDYLRALDLPLEVRYEQKLVFLAGKSSRNLIPVNAPYYFVEVGKAEAKSFSYGLVGLKGYLFKLLAQEVAEKGQDMLLELEQNPLQFINLLGNYRRYDN